jgi:hypothetical protein
MNESFVLNRLTDWRSRGYHMRSPPVTIVSYDPAGDGGDNDAVVVIDREEHQKGEPYDVDFAVEVMFRARLAMRMPPIYEFPDKLGLMLQLYRSIGRRIGRNTSAGVYFAIESNGVGYGMASMLKAKTGEAVHAYTTVGTRGKNAYSEKGKIMPRMAGLSLLKVMIETHYFRAAKEAVGMKELNDELNAFVWTGAGRPEAIQGQNDDLVMASAGAVWAGTNYIPMTLKQQTFNRRAN